ncbi:hypothetical protein [Saccharopolyspora taberi]|uniref:Excreted virulence factor EspC, type VII ESX diderm n=1 Tax=Saccharopolyspora taberi TaxID=60895 RepID=A0ABN3VM62_9PSEU
MAGNLKAIPEELKGFEGLLERNANYFKKIDEWAESTASNTSGFTGLMMALIPAVEAVTALYGETLDFAHSALMKVKDELGNVSAEYEEREKKTIEMLKKIEADLDKMKI